MPDPAVGEGRVELEVQGAIAYLVPSLEACIEISKMAGGLRNALERCIVLNFEAICAIIGAGIEIGGEKLNQRQRNDLLPKAVYEGGVIAMSAKAMEFVHIVSNAGRAPGEDDDEGEGEGDDGPLG